MEQKFIHPQFNRSSFNCPLCHAFAHQHWGDAIFNGMNESHSLNNVAFSHCSHCKKHSLWRDRKMVYPDILIVPSPNPDLPDDIRETYLEAASILSKSPRGAAALMRLCIQELCVHLGEKGKINNAIGNLVKKGLNPTIQQSLDIVRVIGNNAIHPGKIDIQDNMEIALTLFGLTNIIAETLITIPQKVQDTYQNLPQDSLNAIEKRDEIKETKQSIQNQ